MSFSYERKHRERCPRGATSEAYHETQTVLGQLLITRVNQRLYHAFGRTAVPQRGPMLLPSGVLHRQNSSWIRDGSLPTSLQTPPCSTSVTGLSVLGRNVRAGGPQDKAFFLQPAAIREHDTCAQVESQHFVVIKRIKHHNVRAIKSLLQEIVFFKRFYCPGMSRPCKRQPGRNKIDKAANKI